jgi:hypothetical protein
MKTYSVSTQTLACLYLRRHLILHALDEKETEERVDNLSSAIAWNLERDGHHALLLPNGRIDINAISNSLLEPHDLGV